MSAAATLSAHQKAAGQPIRLVGRTAITDSASLSANYDSGVGVKAGATPPTNSSEFVDILRNTTGSVVAGGFLSRWRWAGGVQTTTDYRTFVRKTQPVDANYVVGRYVFAFLEGEGGAIQAASAPYHII